MHLLDKKDKRFYEIFSNSKDYKLLKVLFDNNVPTRKQLQYIEPYVFNEYKSKLNVNCIKEYLINSFRGRIDNPSFQIIFRIDSNIDLTSFNIRLLDNNNNKIGYINSSGFVSYKYKNYEGTYFINSECISIINNLNDEMKEYINDYRNGF